MVKTLREFKDEMKVIREEMYEYGETADIELVASWLDRVVISLERLSDTVELMNVELEVVSKRPGMKAAKAPKKKAAKKKTAKKKAVKKKAVKKKAKKAAKKKPKKAKKVKKKRKR